MEADRSIILATEVAGKLSGTKRHLATLCATNERYSNIYNMPGFLKAFHSIVFKCPGCGYWHHKSVGCAECRDDD